MLDVGSCQEKYTPLVVHQDTHAEGLGSNLVDLLTSRGLHWMPHDDVPGTILRMYLSPCLCYSSST